MAPVSGGDSRPLTGNTGIYIMKTRYFKLNEIDSVGLFNRWLDQVKRPRDAIIRDLTDKYDAEGLRWRGDIFDNSSRAGCCCARGWTVAETSGRLSEARQKKGDNLFCCTPDRRCREGRDLAADLAALNFRLRELPPFSGWAVGVLGCGSQVVTEESGRSALVFSVAGFYPEKKSVVVKVPVDEEVKHPLPDVNASLIEIKHSEFIAITEE